MSSAPIKIVIIVGSVRPGNYTSKAVNIVQNELTANARIDVRVIDPREMNLPLPGLAGDQNQVDLLRNQVSEATGVILATPEYHGGYSSVIKLVIENLGFPSALKAKPVALLGVAAGKIGAIKSLESLRSICSHVGALVLPGAISIASVNSVFAADGSCKDPLIEKQLQSLANNLVNYITDHICPKSYLEEIARSNRQ
jgi:FMN reductase